MFNHKIERSSSSHAILEVQSRKKKATKIAAILQEVVNISESKLLDVGTGSGNIAYELSKKAKKVCSVDIVDERKEKTGYEFKITKDESIPYPDNTFEIVVTNHVIEHTPNQKKHVEEILRVLKPEGYIYLATPNKLWLTDPHYKLPFISWLPRSASCKYLKVIQKKEWDIYPLSARKISLYFGLNKITNALPLLLVSDASNTLDTWRLVKKLAKIIPGAVLDSTRYMSPTLIFLIKKTELKIKN